MLGVSRPFCFPPNLIACLLAFASMSRSFALLLCRWTLVVLGVSRPFCLTTKAAHFCPPPVLADLWRQLARGASRRAPHALLMVVHEVVGAQHAPARARLRLAAVLAARGLGGALGPSDSEATPSCG